MKKKELSASVLVFVEDVDDEAIIECLKNVKEQTYKNVEIIISSFKDDNSEEVKQNASNMFLNCRWIHQKPSPFFINEALKMATGDIIFYKTINNVLWFPRHIESHIELFDREKKLKWSLSHLENKDLSKNHITYNTLSFRIQNPPQPSEIIIDEISHHSGISADWSKCIVQNGEQTGFVTGKILEQWNKENLRGGIPSEITVIQWIDQLNTQNDQQQKQIAQSIGVPSLLETKEETIETDEGIEIVRKIPTIMGNVFHKQHNDNFKLVVEQTENIAKIGLKRTIGMGDVVLCEPIIKSLKEKHPNAEINFYTNSTDIVDYFKNKPHNTIKIEQDSLLSDFLSTTDNEVNYDLDLSYESRVGQNFIDSYIDSIGLKFANISDKYPQLENNDTPLIEGEYIVVCGDHSGWVGKTWPISDYEEVIEYLQEKGETVIETGSHHTLSTPTDYHDCDFKTMINLIANCKLYIGGDNGPMHIARGFNKPCIAINGSALTYITNPNRENIYYLQNNTNSNVGIKHKQFFNLRPDGKGITFMPMITEGDEHCGIRDIKPHHVIQAFEKLQDSTYVFNSFGCVDDNNITGFSYHKNEDIIQRERPYYHPENRYDFHKYLENRQYHIDNNLNPIIKDIEKNYQNKEIKILDAGCNIGILSHYLYGLDYKNIFGCDINRVIIEMGKNQFPMLKENLFVCDFAKHIAQEKYDLIIMSDVLSSYSCYNELINRAKENLNKGGVLYFSDFVFDGYYNNVEYSKGYMVNIFEKNILVNKLTSAGFRVEEYFNDENKVYLRCYND